MTEEELKLKQQQLKEKQKKRNTVHAAMNKKYNRTEEGDTSPQFMFNAADNIDQLN